MTDSTRTTTRTHTFRRPFRVSGDHYPAGAYDIQTREAVHEGNDHTVYVRVATVLMVRTFGMTRHREVNPADLEEAIRLDAKPAPCTAGEVR